MTVGIVFPTEHMRRIIAAAREGKTRAAKARSIDGSENGEKIYDTLGVIGKPIAPQERKPTDAAAKEAALAVDDALAGHHQLFRHSARRAASRLPVYSITFELYENGMSRALLLDYNDFVDRRRDDAARDQGQQSPVLESTLRRLRSFLFAVECRCP